MVAAGAVRDSLAMEPTTATQYNPRAGLAGRAAGPTTRCVTCRLGPLCLGNDHAAKTMDAMDEIVHARPMMPGGSVLFREGERFTALYAVRAGFLKTSTHGPDGSEQVLGFHLPGDILGFDAIHHGRYHATATALGSASVCAVPFDQLASLAAGDPALQLRLYGLLSRDINSYFGRLGDATADQRMAAFLVELSGRFSARGFSPRTFLLAMSRRDIGNYLRLATETVSRVLTRFQDEGLIRVTRREVELLDLDKLATLAKG